LGVAVSRFKGLVTARLLAGGLAAFCPPPGRPAIAESSHLHEVVRLGELIRGEVIRGETVQFDRAAGAGGTTPQLGRERRCQPR